MTEKAPKLRHCWACRTYFYRPRCRTECLHDKARRQQREERSREIAESLKSFGNGDRVVVLDGTVIHPPAAVRERELALVRAGLEAAAAAMDAKGGLHLLHGREIRAIDPAAVLDAMTRKDAP